MRETRVDRREIEGGLVMAGRGVVRGGRPGEETVSFVVESQEHSMNLEHTNFTAIR